MHITTLKEIVYISQYSPNCYISLSSFFIAKQKCFFPSQIVQGLTLAKYLIILNNLVWLLARREVKLDYKLRWDPQF